MTKLSVFTRITPTRSNIVTLSKVLKKHGFKLTKTRGKLLFEVAEITSEQVKANFCALGKRKRIEPKRRMISLRVKKISRNKN